ncbi:hypothetical protein ACJMK2_036348 [Sinanodonta woodiana]|uniref:Mediator of RNA polymerase II transcription subunit 17 n=1 Tax=Sinanodonta woodiana TaxID=1069815 RepID=A0ABD3WKA4_SINWO
MASASVNVSVEAVQEHKIQEVTLDGQEIYIPPLSMSENLAKLAHKIDFYKDESEDKGKPTSEGEKEAEEEASKAAVQPSLWPWDNIRNKLKAALTEMSVLLDVLNIAKEKRYMLLDHVSQDAPEAKSAIQLMAKKKGLQSAAGVLLAGAERLKKSQQEMGNRPQNEFHIELLKLRQNWRLKKVGKTILGDLSYKSAGSRFWQGGSFEVIKNTNIASGEGDTMASTRSSLEVVIPTELEGSAFVQVEVKTVEGSMNLTSAILRMPHGLGPYPSDAHWQTKLEAAQNVLFCKELFSQLAREAVQLKSFVPYIVVGNQIISNVFPNVQLSIVLCHSTGKKDKKSQHPGKVEHNHVLEHSLHQLLREVHFKSLNMSVPHPVTATIGVTKRRRMAGSEAIGRRELLEMTESETLLEQIIKQTRHAVLRLRTMKVIDAVASKYPDPQICAHWSCLNSSLESNVRVIITSQGYEAMRPTWQSMYLEIGVNDIKVVTRERRRIILSFEEKEIEDLILWQISQHHIAVCQSLARLLSWQYISHSSATGVGEMEDFATASSVLLVSPNSDKAIAVRSGPTTGLHVHMKSDAKDIDAELASILEAKWHNLTGTFKEVDLNRIDGRNFATKLELIMASVTRKR